ncbi:hypothetical protein [Xanthomonas arboricola]|uniref:hypothetical protein n=1 Tax=Xanthomonas arboricola TaxID=56448 RepID=UPI00142FE9FD|nr:hypothetical protein [Xanthomonas arboricola]NJB80283.1 hypothetical protein [Xanthomonas arboricola]
MVAIPRPQAAIADRLGLPTREWYTYLLDLANSAGMTPDQLQRFEQLVAAVDALQQQGGGRANIQGVGSVEVVGMEIMQIYLVGDNDAPGASWYYGTGLDGAKGWYAVADALAVTPDLTKAVDAGTGVATLGLADLADAGVAAGVALRKFTRDAKGRLAGTAAATTSDLPEGTNRYFTDARADARADARIAAQKGQPNGLASLGTDGKVPAAQLPTSSSGVTSVNARTGAVAVPDFVSKATAPTATDYGRALINGDRWRNTGNGVLYTYQDGAWLYDNAASLSRYVPARLSSGTASPIPLNADGTIPAKLSNGTVSNIPTQA